MISYAHDDGTEHDIAVRLSLSEAELRVDVEDDGRPFNPLQVAEPDPDRPVEDRPIGRPLGVRSQRS